MYVSEFCELTNLYSFIYNLVALHYVFICKCYKMM